MQEGTPPSFGMSFGLAANPEDDGTVMRLVQVADERLLNKHRSGAAITFGGKKAARMVSTTPAHHLSRGNTSA